MIGEQIYGMIPKTEVKPGVTDFNIFITNMRIIGGKVGSSALAGIAGGTIGYAVSRVTIDKNKYANMNPDQIVSANPKNFSWDLNYDITSLEVKKGLTISKIKVQLSPNQGNKRKTIFFNNSFYDYVYDLLNRTIPNKLINNQYPGYHPSPYPQTQQQYPQQPQQQYPQQTYQQPAPQHVQQTQEQKQTTKEPEKPKTKQQSKRPKFCTGCGNKLDAKQKFCTKCGKQI